MFLRVLRRQPRRQVVAVGEPGEAHEQAARHRRVDDLGPHRSKREPEAPSLAAPIPEQPDDRQAAEHADGPRQRPADRAPSASTQELECGVEAGDRGAVREVPDRAANREQAAQRDHEGRHADVGDDESLDRAHERSQADAERQRDEPPEREVGAHPQDVGEPVGHQRGVRHGGEAHERADRQVDVARDDDEDHPGGQDGDARRLDGERDHVDGTEELAVGEQVEAQENEREGDEHAEQTQIDLGRADHPACPRPCRARCPR